MIDNELLLKAREIIDGSDRITVLTGAGISAESGIPTFRGTDGTWNEVNPETVATPQAFKNDPVHVWKWYDQRREIIDKARPNQGHFALSEIERTKEKFTLITQNIDGLHQVAGSQNIIEIHGNIWEIKCEKCGLVIKNYETPLTELPPICRKCEGIMRPNVVWFGEIIPMEVIDSALFAIEQSALIIIIGTSGIVEPAASMGLMAKQSGKKVIEINLEKTFNTGICDISIQAKAGEVLPLLYDRTTLYN